MTEPTPQIAATLARAQHVGIKDTLWSSYDIYFVLAIVVALTVITGFFLNYSRNKRTDDQANADKRTATIMEAIKTSHDDAARDIRSLTDKMADHRTAMEKDIHSLTTKIDHERRNRETAGQGTAHQIERQLTEIRELDRRMTTQEEKSRAQDATIHKLEGLIREKIDETKDLIKAQGDLHTTQFKELANSIREARDAKFRS